MAMAGASYCGRPRRPGDPGYGDGWTWVGFSAALEQDRAEIEDVVTVYPSQAPRLRRWLHTLEALGRRRDRDPRPVRRLDYEGLPLTRRTDEAEQIQRQEQILKIVHEKAISDGRKGCEWRGTAST